MKTISQDMLFEFSPVSLLILDENTNIVMANRAAIELAGGSWKEMVLRRPGNVLGCVHSSKDPRGCGYSKDCPLCPVRNAIEALISNGDNLKCADFPLTLIRDGEPTEIWLEFSAEGFLIDGQRHLFISLNDISQRNRILEQLRLSEKKFRSTFDQSPVGTVMVGLNKQFIKCNPAFCDFLGYSEEELVGKPLSYVTHPEDVEKGMKELAQMIEGSIESTAVQKRYIRKDGDIVWGQISICLIRDEDRAPMYFLPIVQDITNLKKAIDEIHKKEELLRITGKTAQVGGWEIDTETFKQTWTDEVYRIHEVDSTFDPNVSKGISFYAPKSRPVVEKAIELAVKDGEPFDLELEFITAKGNPKWVHSIGMAQRQNGKTIRVYGSIQDITDSKLAEQEIRLRNSELLNLNSTKDKFFSIIAHDLRSPFNSFLGLTKLMTEELSSLSMPQIRDFSLKMSQSADNLYSLLENLLQWARLQQGSIPFSPEPVPLHIPVQLSVNSVIDQAITKQIEVLSEIPADQMVMADTQMLQTIIRNIVSNAVKFTPRGGKVNITAKNPDEERVELSVRDTGIGMNPKMINELFRIDVQTSRRGTDGENSTGLGLLLCKELIDRQGGTISVESQVNEGSTFLITLRKP